MCTSCNSSKGTKKKQGAVLQESREKPLAIADNQKKVIARQPRKASNDANPTSKLLSRFSPQKAIAPVHANPTSKLPSHSSPRKAIAASNANPSGELMSKNVTSTRKRI
jgi:hypothetical protein